MTKCRPTSTAGCGSTISTIWARLCGARRPAPLPLSPAPMSDRRDYRDTVFLPKTEFPMKAGLAQKEPAILARWAAMDLYRRLRVARKGRKRFILHDGAPYANGDIHMVHGMNKILKDIVVRSQSMLRMDTSYMPCWQLQ